LARRVKTRLVSFLIIFDATGSHAMPSLAAELRSVGAAIVVDHMDHLPKAIHDRSGVNDGQ
jgi:hypothetical protein